MLPISMDLLGLPSPPATPGNALKRQSCWRAWGERRSKSLKEEKVAMFQAEQEKNWLVATPICFQCSPLLGGGLKYFFIFTPI